MVVQRTMQGAESVGKHADLGNTRRFTKGGEKGVNLVFHMG
jgi:hypothetical protein